MDQRPGRPIVHLFVGLHKTGTTAIRFMLDVHRDLLVRHGFHLPRATWTRHVDGFWNGGHNNLAWEVIGKRRIVPECGSVAELVHEIGSLPDRQHIVLTEALDRAETEHIDRLKEAFAGFDVRVIVFLRNQLDWLRSMNAEERKFFNAPSSSEWYRTHVADDPRTDFHAFCASWAASFDRITIRAYERIRSRTFDAFLECCGAPDALRIALASRSLPVINISYGELPLALVRHASNLARTLGAHPRYFNSVISPAILTAANRPDLNRRTAAPIPHELLDPLLARMRTTNARLAADFRLDLGPEYLAPAAPDPDPGPTPTPAVFSIDTVADLMASSCFEVGTRAGTRWQFLTSDPTLADQASALATRYHPWSGPDLPAELPLLEELIDDLSATNAALYLERTALACIAYRRVDGEMIEIRRMSESEWEALVQAIQINARLNTASWRNLREGRMILRRGDDMVRFWVLQAPTPDGEIIVAEPLGTPSADSPALIRQAA